MCAQGLTDAWPLSVTKHVDKIQDGRNERLERAVGRQGFHGAAPAGPMQANTPQLNSHDLGAGDDLVLIDEPCGVGPTAGAHPS